MNGCLNLSRAIGDFDFKRNSSVAPYLQAITAYPDVLVEALNNEQDEFILLACDGIWECVSSQLAVDFVGKRLRQAKTPTAVLEDLFDVCLAQTRDGHRGTSLGLDNMTAILVLLKNAYT